MSDESSSYSEEVEEIEYYEDLGGNPKSKRTQNYTRFSKSSNPSSSSTNPLISKAETDHISVEFLFETENRSIEQLSGFGFVPDKPFSNFKNKLYPLMCTNLMSNDALDAKRADITEAYISQARKDNTNDECDMIFHIMPHTVIDKNSLLKGYVLDVNKDAPLLPNCIDIKELGDCYCCIKIWDDTKQTLQNGIGSLENTLAQHNAHILKNILEKDVESFKTMMGSFTKDVVFKIFSPQSFVFNMFDKRNPNNQLAVVLKNKIHKIIQDTILEFNMCPLNIYSTLKIPKDDIFQVTILKTPKSLSKSQTEEDELDFDVENSEKGRSDNDQKEANVDDHTKSDLHIYLKSKIITTGFNDMVNKKHVDRTLISIWEEHYKKTKTTPSFDTFLSDPRIKNTTNSKYLFHFLVCQKIRLEILRLSVSGLYSTYLKKVKNSSVSNMIKEHSSVIDTFLSHLATHQYSLHGHTMFLEYDSFESYANALPPQFLTHKIFIFNNKAKDRVKRSIKDNMTLYDSVLSDYGYWTDIISQDEWRKFLYSHSDISKFTTDFERIGDRILYKSDTQRIKLEENDKGIISAGYLYNKYHLIIPRINNIQENNMTLYPYREDKDNGFDVSQRLDGTMTTVYPNRSLMDYDNEQESILLQHFPVSLPNRLSSSMHFSMIAENEENRDDNSKSMIEWATSGMIHVEHQADSQNRYHILRLKDGYNGALIMNDNLLMSSTIKDKMDKRNNLLNIDVFEDASMDYKLLPPAYCKPNTDHWMLQFFQNKKGLYTSEDIAEPLFTTLC